MQNSISDHSRGGKRGLTFMSWNTRGLNNPVKSGKVLAHLKSLNSDIMFLQETHLKNDSHNRLRTGWIKDIYHSTFSMKTRGAVILIRKGLPFTQKKQGGTISSDNRGDTQHFSDSSKFICSKYR